MAEAGGWTGYQRRPTNQPNSNNKKHIKKHPQNRFRMKPFIRHTSSHPRSYVDALQVQLPIVTLNYKAANCDLDYFPAWSFQLISRPSGTSHQWQIKKLMPPWGWGWVGFRVSPNPNHSVILWNMLLTCWSPSFFWLRGKKTTERDVPE